MLVDSHAHLTLPQFEDDRKEVIQRAYEAGIRYIITIGTDLEDCHKALTLADEYDFIFASVGIHPHDAKTITEDTYSTLRVMAAHKKVVAIGEIGLDFYRNLSSPEIQREHFRKQLRLAREVSLPVIIHDRDAHQEIIQTLREEQAEDVGGVIHCFSGDWKTANVCLDMGFYLSFPGTITFKHSKVYHEMINKLPFDRLLLETDSPFLTPHPFRGKRNEPALVRYVAEALARIKGLDVGEVAKITSENARKLFKLPV